jgi:hypothetical protein
MFSVLENIYYRDVVITKNVIICIAIIKSSVKTHALNKYFTYRILDFCIVGAFFLYGIRFAYQQEKDKLNITDYERNYFIMTVLMHIFTVGILYAMCDTI